MPRVKKNRTYDSSGRSERARERRAAIVEVARRRFLASGYAATTIAAVAEEAGVSVETVYKAFGGKVGLVRAISERGLAGRGPVPAYQRSDDMSAREPDPRALLRHWGRLAAEVSPLVSPILLLVRAAAATDPDADAILEDSHAERLTRMRQNARVLAKRGFLRPGLTVERAAELMWMHTAPELYELLVIRRGWTPEAFGERMAEAMIAELLPPEAQPSARAARPSGRKKRGAGPS